MASLNHGYRFEIIAGEFDENDREIETNVGAVSFFSKDERLTEIVHGAIREALEAEADRLRANGDHILGVDSTMIGAIL